MNNKKCRRKEPTVPIRKSVDNLKGKVVSVFEINTLKQTAYRTGKKESEENIIENFRNLFIIKKENKEIKDIIITDIRTLFEQGDNYCKPERVNHF